MTIRIGIIGAGAIGYRVAKGFGAHAETTVTVICDANPELAAKVAGELGAPYSHTDYRTMLEQDLVDLVYVGVPPAYHQEIVLAVIAAGKHLFCEKPLALTLDEARTMLVRAESAGTVHAVNLSGHFAPTQRHFLEQLQAGYIGELRRGEIDLVFPEWPRAWQQNTWIAGREQGGPLRETGPHLFHIVLQAFGPVARVHAMMEYPANPTASETGGYGVLELTSGQLVTVKVLTGVRRPNEMSLTVYGSKGALALRNWSLFGAQDEDALQPMSAPAAGPQAIDELVKAVRGEEADLPNFREGLAIQAILEAWERSAATGQWIEVPK
jgi:predicted dehydrogenase